jgi:adenosyl cobinamide kinase/adenosyl cobinamide phosphate guanylyltransferase
MELILGGVGQGKRAFVQRRYALPEQAFVEEFSTACENQVFVHYEQAVRRALQAGEDPAKLTAQVLEANPSVLILCDEVGCGVVPVAREERLWREQVGRLCCQLAERADAVYRLFCGIPQRLK